MPEAQIFTPVGDKQLLHIPLLKAIFLNTESIGELIILLVNGKLEKNPSCFMEGIRPGLMTLDPLVTKNRVEAISGLYDDLTGIGGIEFLYTYMVSVYQFLKISLMTIILITNIN